MEAALGQAIPDGVRNSVVTIVQSYFEWQRFEHNAPYLDDVLKRISAIKKAAEHFQQALRGPENTAEWDTNQVVRSQIGQSCEIQGVAPGLGQIESIESALSCLIWATGAAKTHFSERAEGGFSEGQAWQKMARSLKGLMREHSLPFGASQDSSKSKNSAGSPFVQFMQALQNSFPHDLRRHHGISPFALAKEINRAEKLGRVPIGS
jgi:hypothetical protein